MAELDKIELVFKKAYTTKRKVRYDEQLGEYEFSRKGPALDYMYPYTEAMELIGSPEKVRVTIEPEY